MYVCTCTVCVCFLMTTYNHENTHDSMAEWLRRQIRNLLGSSRVGSSPAAVERYISFCHFFNLLPPHHYVLLHLSHPSPPNLPHHHPPTLLPTTTTNSSHISIPNQHFTQSSTFNTTQHKRKRKHTHTSPNLPQDNPQINTHNVHNTYNIDTHSGPQHQTTNNPHMCHNKQSTTATTTASPYPSVTSSTLPYNSHTRLR